MGLTITDHSAPSPGPTPADEEEYQRLRQLAYNAGRLRREQAALAKAAWASNSKARASLYSRKAKAHAADATNYNLRARELMFQANNLGRPSDEVDLHGLYAAEVDDVLREVMRERSARGVTGLHVIVGKGNHARDGKQKVKPAVEALCAKMNLTCETEANEGRVFVTLRQAKVPQAVPRPATPPASVSIIRPPITRPPVTLPPASVNTTPPPVTRPPVTRPRPSEYTTRPPVTRPRPSEYTTRPPVTRPRPSEYTSRPPVTRPRPSEYTPLLPPTLRPASVYIPMPSASEIDPPSENGSVFKSILIWLWKTLTCCA